MSALLTQSPGDTVQTGTGKVDLTRKIKGLQLKGTVDVISSDSKFNLSTVFLSEKKGFHEMTLFFAQNLRNIFCELLRIFRI